MENQTRNIHDSYHFPILSLTCCAIPVFSAFYFDTVLATYLSQNSRDIRVTNSNNKGDFNEQMDSAADEVACVVLKTSVQ